DRDRAEDFIDVAGDRDRRRTGRGDQDAGPPGVDQQRRAGRDLMPGFLLHVGATVICQHGGQAQPTGPNPRGMVSNQPTVTVSGPYAVVAAGLTAPAPPCATANWIVGATRLLSGGQPLLLQDSQAICVAPGTPLQVLVTQVRAKGQ